MAYPSLQLKFIVLLKVVSRGAALYIRVWTHCKMLPAIHNLILSKIIPRNKNQAYKSQGLKGQLMIRDLKVVVWCRAAFALFVKEPCRGDENEKVTVLGNIWHLLEWISALTILRYIHIGLHHQKKNSYVCETCKWNKIKG